jgi:signal transduction histidine kinase/ligand-binding sensor domain-containing protein
MECAPSRFAAPTSPIRRLVVPALMVTLLCFSAPLSAQRSFFRMYDQDYGLDVGEIAALAQDRSGFIWIGAHRGLIRFDGRSFVSWGQDQVDEVVSQIIDGPDGELLIRTATGRAWRRTAHGLDPVAGPGGEPLQLLDAFDFAADGQLWAIIDAKVWRRGESWSRIDRGIPPNEKSQRIFAAHDDVIVLTDVAAWRLHGEESAQRLVVAKDLWFATAADDGSIWLAAHFGDRLWRVDRSGVHQVERPGGRALDMRARNDTLWLSLDKVLLAYPTDGSPRRLGIAEGLPSGGPLLVDSENSLWLGTFVGLLQFPEPDTWQWGEPEGLPSAHTYAVTEYEGTIFGSTWSGLAHIDPARERRFVFDASAPVFAGICAIAGHGVWAFDQTHLMQWRDHRFVAVAGRPPGALIDSCAADMSGRVWIATTNGLLRVDPGQSDARQIAVEPAATIDELWFDADGELRVLTDDSICRLRFGENDTAMRQQCGSIGSVLVPNSIAPVAPNRTWIAANNGIFEFDGERTRRLPGNHLLTGGIIQSLTQGTAGDWWAAGAGALLRVHDCGGCAVGWEVRETPGQWHGLPANSSIQAREAANGDLWIAGNRGIWRVPKSARHAPALAPRVTPVRASVDAAEQDIVGAIELPPDAHRLDLEFAALSFRDRTLLRFRSRLAGSNDWSAPSRSPILQFAALAPGSYRAEMAASLDGNRWSDPPAHVEFRVLPPWYRTWWARALFALAALALLAWIYRLRVAALLRIERERTRIAMDLHDELGTGLGSIGMLAGVAARDGLEVGEQRRLVREIANLSGLLGSGLRSLVWSLRSERAGIAELGAQIADNARRLFPGDSPRLSVQLPVEPGSAPLPPELRRHVLLIALESLHNVARHARAGRVTVILEATAGGLRLIIEDDGRGFNPAQDSVGAGLESMRRRAAAIGAQIEIESGPQRGSRIVLSWVGGGIA